MRPNIPTSAMMWAYKMVLSFLYLQLNFWTIFLNEAKYVFLSPTLVM